MFPSLYGTQKFITMFSLPLVPGLSQMNPVHTTTSYLFTIYFNIILLCLGIQYGLFSFRHHKPVRISLLPHMCRISHWCHAAWFNGINSLSIRHLQPLRVWVASEITHKNAPQSVGILWTSDQPVAETSSWQHTQHSQRTTIHAPGGIRTHNLSKQSAVDTRLRPLGHWDRLDDINSVLKNLIMKPLISRFSPASCLGPHIFLSTLRQCPLLKRTTDQIPQLHKTSL